MSHMGLNLLIMQVSQRRGLQPGHLYVGHVQRDEVVLHVRAAVVLMLNGSRDSVVTD